MHKNVPEIRFKGFSGEWVEKELGEITSKIGSGKTPKGGDSTYVLEGVPLIRSQNIYNNLVNLINVAYITPQTHEDMKNSSVFKNDVLLNITGASIGRSAVYNFPSEANVNQHVCIVRLYEGYNSAFTQLHLTSTKGQQLIDNNQAGGAREGLNFQQIGRMNFSFTSTEEQTKIGNTFQKLDSLINQHQKKHDKLSSIKKAMLERMFPIQGETIPEIRFKGFSGEWEEKPLKKVASDITDGNWIESEHIFESGEFRIIQTGNIGIGQYLDRPKHTKFFHQLNFDVVRGNEIYPGDILISRLAEPAGRAAILPDTGYRMVTAVDVAIVRPESTFNSYFLMTLFNMDQTLKAVGEWVSGTSHKRISHANLVKVGVIIPCVEEQTAIGNYFQKLDKLINQHQQQITKLNNVKQACLSKMFV